MYSFWINFKTVFKVMMKDYAVRFSSIKKEKIKNHLPSLNLSFKLSQFGSSSVYWIRDLEGFTDSDIFIYLSTCKCCHSPWVVAEPPTPKRLLGVIHLQAGSTALTSQMHPPSNNPALMTE